MYAATRGELIAEIWRLVAVIDAFEAGLLDIAIRADRLAAILDLVVASRGRAQSIAAELVELQAVVATASARSQLRIQKALRDHDTREGDDGAAAARAPNSDRPPPACSQGVSKPATS
jgi:hypothetical protein